MPRSVALVTLGCGRNEVDSEELAGRLTGDGWAVGTDPARADVVLVNTCAFVAAAKKDSLDTLLAAADTGRPVVAVGCLAERYGAELADALPEAAAVLGFDDYPAIGARLQAVLDGQPPAPHRPVDRRRLLPVSPVDRAAAPVSVPGHGRVGSLPPRLRLGAGPVAALKLASGCDRRCTFCAIPTFRGAFVSRRPEEVLADAHRLAAAGARELVLVSENSTSYGKDLGDVRALERLLPQLAAVPGVVRLRVSYLQPAELRPGLVEVLAATPGVAPYFDLSFQHASAPVLRRMRRFGDGDAFLGLLDRVRSLAPAAGVRSNVIVGFPGETRTDLARLERFLGAAGLDAVGVFGYSDEDGTEAAGLPGKLRPATVARRVDRVAALAEELMAQRAEDRVGDTVDVLVERVDARGAHGRAGHQGPEDGTVRVTGRGFAVGDVVRCRVTAADGADLRAVPATPLARVG